MALLHLDTVKRLTRQLNVLDWIVALGVCGYALHVSLAAGAPQWWWVAGGLLGLTLAALRPGERVVEFTRASLIGRRNR